MLLGHSLLILWLIEPRLQFVGVLQHLPLFVLQPLELLLEFFLLLRRLGRFEGGLQLLEPLVQVVLSLGQLAKPVEDLAVLPLFGGLLMQFLGGLLRLVAVFLFLQIELIELLALLL